MATECGKPALLQRQDFSERSKRFARLRRRLLIAAFVASAIAMVLFSAISAEAAVQAAPNLNSLFYEANSRYEKGEYAGAAEAYEEILQAGYASGNLYYNLANAYYRDGQTGLAFLNYLRAQRLIPRDPDLRANLEHVQKELQLPEESQGFVRWIATRLTDWLTVQELATVATVFFTALALSILLWLYLPAWKRLLGPLAVIAGFGLVLAMGGVSLAALVYGGDRAVVVVEEAVVRFEPTASGSTHYTLSEGSSVVVEDSRDEWVQVRRSDGKKGWVSAREVEEIKLKTP